MKAANTSNTVRGPWSATKNHHHEYLTWIKLQRAEIPPEGGFYVLLDNPEVASSNLKYFACTLKKGDSARWSLVRDSVKQHEKKVRMR